jgi:hypothetical protein
VPKGCQEAHPDVHCSAAVRCYVLQCTDSLTEAVRVDVSAVAAGDCRCILRSTFTSGSGRSQPFELSTTCIDRA